MPDICTHCGSDKIVPDAVVMDRSSVGQIEYEGELQVSPKKGRPSVPVLARVCGGCGRVELLVADPAEFYLRSQPE